MNAEESLSLEQLKERISQVANGRLTSTETLEALSLGFVDPDTTTKPIERGLGEAGVVYAWRSEDADVVEAALDFLENVPEILAGEIVGAGKGLKELLTFWVRLRRNRVRLDDPLQVAVLLELKHHGSGASSSTLRRALAGSAMHEAPSLDAIEAALDQLARGKASTGTKELVVWDGQLWKSLV